LTTQKSKFGSDGGEFNELSAVVSTSVAQCSVGTYLVLGREREDDNTTQLYKKKYDGEGPPMTSRRKYGHDEVTDQHD
jgi:hypothetical protein